MNDSNGRKSLGIAVPMAGGLLVAAAAVSLLTGRPGVNEAKVTGLLLALAAFVPVFMMLLKAMRSGSTNEVLGTFVGGCFFKLLVLGVGIWWGIKKAGYPMFDFSLTCLSFLVAFQIIESLYFAQQK